MGKRAAQRSAGGEHKKRERGTVTHYVIVGTERIEVGEPTKTVAHKEQCLCPACRMDEVVRALGGENLE